MEHDDQAPAGMPADYRAYLDQLGAQLGEDSAALDGFSLHYGPSTGRRLALVVAAPGPQGDRVRLVAQAAGAEARTLPAWSWLEVFMQTAQALPDGWTSGIMLWVYRRPFDFAFQFDQFPHPVPGASPVPAES